MAGPTIILGFGPVGRLTANALAARGERPRIVQRTPPADLPGNMDFASADVLDVASLRAACMGAGAIVAAFGFPYRGALWLRDWPRAAYNLLNVAADADARVIFFDNLYMYGPTPAPLREDTPYQDFGRKPAARAAVARLFDGEHRIPWACLRCTDFFGPGVVNAHLGRQLFADIAAGKRAWLFPALDKPHDFAFMPDIARAIVHLLDAPLSDFGQSWHMPCAPTQTPRQILQRAAHIAGTPLRAANPPALMRSLLSLMNADIRELRETAFIWNTPYFVDGGKFTRRFHFTPTAFDEAIAQTMRAI